MAGTQNQPAEFEQVTYNAPDGAQMGRTSTEKLAFYGNTPIIRNSTSNPDISTTSSQSTSSGAGINWAFITLTEFNAFVTAVSTMQKAMKDYGLLT